ncbi:MAG: alpha-1,4-glucan--maltose-1-phosphate maltosyltransferase [Dehalococcoidia bacterium]
MTAPVPRGKQPPHRAVIDAVMPEVDAGRYAAKSSLGERFRVTAHVYADGHDRLQARVLHRVSGAAGGEDAWCEAPMEERGNDEWAGEFAPGVIGRHEYTVIAWVDRFGSWLEDLGKRVDAGWDVASELQEGARLVGEAARRVEESGHADEARMTLLTAATWLADEDVPQARRIEIARDPSLREAMTLGRDRARDATYRRVLPLWVDRERARFGAWYEMFPRSVTPDPERSGTFREAAARLDDIAGMGFDVLYLPPVHPIGETHRKGANNTLHAAADDPGSPWAIGSRDGGHMAVDPGLGTIEDFEWFVQEAARAGLEVALDLAYQCSPDHPWVREHPSWFRQRPDGSIKHAENPPKQYQDIYPIDFETADWRALWGELRRVVLFWIERGVRIFRVDNPHTKPFPFWEWLIDTVHEEHPDVIFLAEAFTRPKRMAGLAKLGFTQSYSYFTWRNTKHELTEYLQELTSPPLADVMRANFFANTPDILHEYLQHGGRPAFLVRLALAATLGPSYGIYSGYEFAEREPHSPGSEEYLDSEKYQLRPRDWDAEGNIKPQIARLNALRHEHPALQHNHGLRFLPIDNDQVIAYVKSDPASGEEATARGALLAVVSLDPRAPQGGWVGVPLDALGLRSTASYVVRELLTDRRFTWEGEWNYVGLEPDAPAQIFAFEGLVEGYVEDGGVRP